MEAVIAEDPVAKQLCEPLSRDCRIAGVQVTLLGKPVHEYTDGIESFRDGEVSSEKVLPRVLWDG